MITSEDRLNSHQHVHSKQKLSSRIKKHWKNRSELFSKLKNEMERLADVEARYARRANMAADLGKPRYREEFYEIEQYLQVLQAA